MFLCLESNFWTICSFTGIFGMLAHLDSIYVTFKRPRSQVKVQGCHGYCTAWIVNFHNAGDIWWMRLNYIGNVLSLGISGWCNLKWVTAFLAWYPATKRVLKFLTAIILYCYNICRRWIGFCQFTQWFFDFHKKLSQKLKLLCTNEYAYPGLRTSCFISIACVLYYSWCS